jgi:hypothetical protein
VAVNTGITDPIDLEQASYSQEAVKHCPFESWLWSHRTAELKGIQIPFLCVTIMCEHCLF